MSWGEKGRRKDQEEIGRGGIYLYWFESCSMKKERLVEDVEGTHSSRPKKRSLGRQVQLHMTRGLYRCGRAAVEAI